MKNMRFVLFCVLFWVCFMINNGTSDVPVKYFPQRNTWFEAKKICKSKGGRLATDKDITLTCSEHEGDTDSDKGHSFWSGKYTTMTAWISREGCYDISNISEMSHSLSLSDCFEVCRHQTTFLHSFAYRSRDQNCVCLHRDICMIPHEGYNCSDFLKSNTTYFKYSIVPNTSFNSTGECAFVECRNGHRLEASTCTDHRRPFCDILGSSDWMMSQKKCKDNIPMNITYLCKSKNIPDNDLKGIWLPIQKVAFSTEISYDGSFNDQSVTQCTYYHCNKGREGTRTLANTACTNKTDGFFCFLPNGTTTNVNTKQQTTNILMEHIVTKDATKYSKQTATSYTGLIVGGVVGTVLLIVAIVFVIVLKIRCKNATSKKGIDNLYAMNNGQSPVYEDQHRKTYSTNDKMFNNKLYDEQCLPSCKFVPDESRLNDVYSIQMKTGKVEKEEDSKDGNEFESEYDVLNKTPSSLNSKLEHNIYDTTIVSRCESDPTYNIATNVMLNREIIDDTYDKL